MVNKNQIVNILKQNLDSKFPGLIKDVILFGSQVKGNLTADSDYDILIITSKKIDWKIKQLLRDICYDISLEYDIFIDSKFISNYELKNSFWGKHPLYTDAINYGIHAR